jgi:hypothetical protein
MLSLAIQDLKRKAPVLLDRWSATSWRRVEATRDRIMRGVGTSEAFIPEDWQKFAAFLGRAPASQSWRKPLSIEEINRMAPTMEVKERRGRP